MHSFDFNLLFCLHFKKPELPPELREKIFKATSDVRKWLPEQEQLPPFFGLSKSAAKRRAKRYDKCVKCGNWSHDGKLQAERSVRKGSNVYYEVRKELRMIKDLGLGMNLLEDKSWWKKDTKLSVVERVIQKIQKPRKALTGRIMGWKFDEDKGMSVSRKGTQVSFSVKVLGSVHGLVHRNSFTDQRDLYSDKDEFTTKYESKQHVGPSNWYQHKTSKTHFCRRLCNWKFIYKNYVMLPEAKIWRSIIRGPQVPMYAKADGTQALKQIENYIDEDYDLVERDLKALSSLTMALSPDIAHSFKDCTSAKQLWQSLEKVFEGNDDMKASRKEMLLQKFNMFNHILGGSLEVQLQRFTKLVTEMMGAKIELSRADLNRKL
ncbi:hypothetical protein L1987_48595 [Smallanthus sonchifolius]|uniref:Uncharacterized protein n=1 Tax=Smallanthus sonchifolius TaxID=185202 RepID=A0ACB9FSF4_9ASTR|nr:hypothetical protein L1987_48595 [Smallanthus sonchifolius]